MNGKLIITELYDKKMSAYFEEGKVKELKFHDKSILGNIYIGRVQNVVGNIDAAFIEIQKGLICYYSMKENKHPIFLNKKNNNKVNIGDLMLVQVSKDDIKTKAPTVTCEINLAGKYAVLTYGKSHIGISNKIKNEHWKKVFRNLCEPYIIDNIGYIIRTNAGSVPAEIVVEEIQKLKEQFDAIMKKSEYLSAFSCIYTEGESYIAAIRDMYANLSYEIITDKEDIYTNIKEYLTDKEPDRLDTLRMYDDKMLPLIKLYSLEKCVTDALRKNVWLKSGAYLVIEPTEALTVIDVNTGKYSGKKNSSETYLKINIEAAKEACAQIRLRNISGIIIIDFIDMESESDRHKLMDELKLLVSKDPIKTTVVDMTSLNLVEMTRKKVRKPLYEQISLPKSDN